MSYDAKTLAAEVVATLNKKDAGAGKPNPAATIVASGRDADRPDSVSKPFSFLRLGQAMLNFKGNGNPESFGGVKYENDVSDKLAKRYANEATGIGATPGARIVPTNTRALIETAETSKDERMAVELHERVKGYDFRQIDQDDHAAYAQRREKALNMLADADGGILRGPAQVGDLIEIMRNTMVFDRAGATEVTLPANGMLKLPKKVGSTNAWWEGEGYALANKSQPKLGVLELLAKKLYSVSEITNDMQRMSSVDGEALIRKDIAASSARVADKTMLQGVSPISIAGGAKAPRGLLSYTRPGTPLTVWTEFQDYLIEYTAGVVGANGNTFQPEDIEKMIAVLPDEVQDSDNLKFVGRNDFFAAITNRRADAVTASDGKGVFMFNITRSADEKTKKTLRGSPYIGSFQVSNQRGKGGGSNLTYLLAGDFTEWVIARLPVAEFLPNALADTAYFNDTTHLRMIQYIDAGSRHASAFVLCDQLING